jgi:hypothetical protein
MKNMRQIFLFFLLITTANPTFGQKSKPSEEVAVKAAIDQLFEGMRTMDSLKIRAVIYSKATLKTAFVDENGNPKLHSESIEDFIKSVGSSHKGIYDEKIWSYDIKIDGGLATAWTEYSFYLDKELLHCGVNAFELLKSDKGWKIIDITDTRRTDNCKAEPKYVINEMIDNWHRAAATADEDVFFGSMTEDCVYIGTDKSERWLREEMKVWSAAFFKRDKAWDFKPIEREVYLSDDGKLAWFNETLNTWMGVCRSSGVVALVDDEWKLKQYHLSVTVPNDVVKDFIELVKKYEEK